MPTKFYKYQGLGNDFIILDGRKNDLNDLFLHNKNNFIKNLCDRNFGVGADGIILLLNSSINCLYQMKIFNSDGSEPEMCGNGIRCLISYLINNNLVVDKNNINIETKAGIISSSVNADNDFRVNMGVPSLEPQKIPTLLKLDNNNVPSGNITINNNTLKVYAAGMGNPHMILFVKNIDEIPFRDWGQYLEQHKSFPSNTNVHFVQVLDKSNIKVKVWERGCGPTLACGTGACACVVVSSKLGVTLNRVNVSLPGGKLFIEWPENKNNIYMSGPAIEVFSGFLKLDKV